ncbi:Cysteine rich receptor like kinase [Trema orientale]|uniref:Cysteine rich receptor like kinase n=1 Tax=Trema orientale TaxID=63057 RepID=A0A2P5FJ09_TREOI|nr:Cysteine rich receptor like kinase [Trema orientale]
MALVDWLSETNAPRQIIFHSAGQNSKGRSNISQIFSKKLFIISVLLILVAQASAQPSFLFESCRNDNGNYTTDSPYQANLNRVLANLTSGDAFANGGVGFYNFSYGRDFDRVCVIGLCRGGDVEPNSCRGCLNQSAHLLTRACPSQKEAIGGFDECMLRYSNRSLFGLMETRPRFYSWSNRDVSTNSTDRFSRDLRVLFENLKSRAANGGFLGKYAAGNYSGDRALYGFAQCTPDLSQVDCRNCLDEAFGDFLGPNGRVRVGGRVITPSCSFRYEVYPFYGLEDETDAPPTSRVQSTPPSSPPLTTKGKKSNKSRTIIIATVVPSVASVVLIISIGVYSSVKKTIHKEDKDRPSFEAAEEIGNVECLQFNFSTIRVATNNFSEENKFAQGASGYVYYRGKLCDGLNILVKCFNAKNSSRDFFKNELLFSAKLQHRNLVRHLGFCSKGNKRFFIYEFLPQSLDRLIFDPLLVEQSYLDWDTRYRIIRGIARGLLYLHEDCHFTIIHRDIKASKILLDEEMNPKISGFGLAKSIEVDRSGDFSVLAGTIGYLDPEYMRSGIVSVKTDVYSFGVLLLEILSGQRSISSNHDGEREFLVNTAWRNWREGTALNLVDLQIRDGSEESEIMRCIHIGLLCVQTRSYARPTMSSVVHMLNCNCLSLPIPSEFVDVEESSIVSSEQSPSSVFNSGMIESFHSKSEIVQESAYKVSIEVNNLYVVILVVQFVSKLKFLVMFRGLTMGGKNPDGRFLHNKRGTSRSRR